MVWRQERGVARDDYRACISSHTSLSICIETYDYSRIHACFALSVIIVAHTWEGPLLSIRATFTYKPSEKVTPGCMLEAFSTTSEPSPDARVSAGVL